MASRSQPFRSRDFPAGCAFGPAGRSGRTGGRRFCPARSRPGNFSCPGNNLFPVWVPVFSQAGNKTFPVGEHAVPRPGSNPSQGGIMPFSSRDQRDGIGGGGEVVGHTTDVMKDMGGEGREASVDDPWTLVSAQRAMLEPLPNASNQPGALRCDHVRPCRWLAKANAESIDLETGRE